MKPLIALASVIDWVDYCNVGRGTNRIQDSTSLTSDNFSYPDRLGYALLMAFYEYA